METKDSEEVVNAYIKLIDCPNINAEKTTDLLVEQLKYLSSEELKNVVRLLGIRCIQLTKAKELIKRLMHALSVAISTPDKPSESLVEMFPLPAILLELELTQPLEISFNVYMTI